MKGELSFAIQQDHDAVDFAVYDERKPRCAGFPHVFVELGTGKPDGAGPSNHKLTKRVHAKLFPSETRTSITAN